AAAQSCYGHGIGRTPRVGSHFAYYHHQGLSVGDLNLERLLRVRAEATVSNPVGADVSWIEAPHISSREDEVGADGHALLGTSRVGERVGIVMARGRITKDRTCRSRWTRLRNTAAEQSISLRGIARVDASNYHDRCAGRRC